MNVIDINNQIEKINKFVNDGDNKKAAELSPLILKQFPDNEEAQTIIDQIQLEESKHYNFDDNLNELVSFLNISDFFNFEKRSKELFSQYENNPLFNYLLGKYFYSKNSYGEAINYYQKTIDKYPFFDVLFCLANCHHNLKNYNSAIGMYTELLQSNPNNTSLLYDLGNCHLSSGNINSSVKAFQSILDNSNTDNDYKALCSLGLISKDKFDLDKAQEYLRKSVKLNPENYEAQNNMGIILIEKNQYKEAIKFFKKAINCNQNAFEPLINLGAALAKEDLFIDAVDILTKAIKINPNISEAHSNLSGVYNSLKQYKDAEKSALLAINLDQKNIDAISNLSTSFIEQDKNKEAIKLLDYANTLNPNNFNILYGYGLALKNIGNFKESKEKFFKSLEVQTNNPKSIIEKARVYEELRIFDKAIKLMEDVLIVNPDYIIGIEYLGHLNLVVNKPDIAKCLYEKALKLDPNYKEAMMGLGLAYIDLYLFDEGITWLEKANDNQDINLEYNFNNLGLANFKKGNFSNAKKFFKRAIQIKNNFAQAHCNFANLSLLSKDFKIGWEEYEWRLDPKMRSRLHDSFINLKENRWHREESLDNRTILVRSEQGLGDTIQFCKYVKLLKSNTTKVVLEVQDCLVDLIKSLDNEIDVVKRSSNFTSFDFQVPLLSLPFEFETKEENFPSNISYLSVNEERTKYWKSKIDDRNFNIGIAWQGSTGLIDQGRSFPLNKFKNISNLNNIKLFNLQKNDGYEQILENQDINLISFDEDLDKGDQAFLDTVALIKSLDLVICSDTSIAHLAGSVGCPTWVVLKFLPDWRWFLSSTDTPWYKNTKLFRQTENNNWDTVFSKIENELQHSVNLNKI